MSTALYCIQQAMDCEYRATSAAGKAERKMLRDLALSWRMLAAEHTKEHGPAATKGGASNDNAHTHLSN